MNLRLSLLIAAACALGTAAYGQSITSPAPTATSAQPAGQAQPTPAKQPAAAQPVPRAATAASAPASAPAADQPPFKPEELEQMLAPLALYPDALLSQVLMASTYPVEVVEAERWAKKNSKLKGDQLAAALEKQPWDPSVRSLVNFPDVLMMMSENLSTTVKIGDAFIGQQKEVMDTVQKLRAKAKEAGNLQTSQQQEVTVVEQEGADIIVIESSDPEVIYVPQYNPTVIYGTWPYPAYPPYPYYPPGYAGGAFVSFGLGVAIGAAWGYAWGDCDWHGGDINIDVDRNNNFNGNIDRDKFRNRADNKFRHDPAHRQGATYRNQASAQRVGATNTAARTTQARGEYRGKAESGRADIARGNVNQPSTRQTTQNRSGTNRNSALQDSNRSGTSAKQYSNRGASSRSSSPSRKAAPSRSSGSRSYSGSRGGSRGGGSRGGGGRR
jgi:hypothetical protein